MTEQAHIRAGILLEVEAGRLAPSEAAAALKISERYLRMLRGKLKHGGPTALNHGNVGRVPWHAFGAELKDHIVSLALSPRYEEMNQHQFTEYLAKYEGIVVSRSFVHRTLRQKGIRSPRPHKRRKRYFKRRTRSAAMGQMVQLDASFHRWVKSLPKFAIVAGIDDATSYLWLAIRPQEDSQGYMEVLRQITAKHGIPRSLYTDGFNSMHGQSQRFKAAAKKKADQAQLKRAFRQLGIRTVIRAHTPQAKGRIERSFDTLQDRLSAHFRFDEVQTMQDVERSMRSYLRNHNKRFAHPPRATKSVFRKWPAHLAADDVFCWRYIRVVRNDNTISFNNLVVDLPPTPNNESLAKCRVDVLENFDGSLAVKHEGRLLAMVMPKAARPHRRSDLPKAVIAERISAPLAEQVPAL